MTSAEGHPGFTGSEQRGGGAWIGLFKQAFASWRAHKAAKMGAALAYYTALSLAPLVLLTVSVLGYFLSGPRAREEVTVQATELVGDAGGATIKGILEQSSDPASGLLATIVSFAVLLVGASGVFGELQDSLNQIWGAKPPERPILTMIRDRLASIAMVFSLGFLVLVSLVLSTALAVIGNFLQERLPGIATVWELTNSGVLLIILTLLFAALFRFLPDVRVAWRDVWTGAVITAVLFVLGKLVLGLYIGRSAVGSAYGAAGSLIVVLLWVFYSAQIFFFGAEITYASAQRRGAIRP